MTKTISAAQAREIMTRSLAERYRSVPVEVTAFHKIDIGWIGAYQSADYLRTHDDRYEIMGNGPIVVTHDGQVHRTGTSRPIDEYVDEIRRSLAPSN